MLKRTPNDVIDIVIAVNSDALKLSCESLHLFVTCTFSSTHSTPCVGNSLEVPAERVTLVNDTSTGKSHATINVDMKLHMIQNLTDSRI